MIDADLTGSTANGFGPVGDTLVRFAAEDGDYHAQVAAWVGGRPVVDLSVGLAPDAIMVVFSSTKGASALVMATLVERGRLDLDERVSTYWPEFAAAGKEAVTVRQLLSHQVGVPEVDGGLTLEDLLGHTTGAARLAAQLPLWRPASGFGYHALSIGVLMDELCRRITGVSLADFWHREIREPFGIDLHIGLAESEEHRVVNIVAQRPLTPEQAASQLQSEATAGPIGGFVFAPKSGHDLVQMANLRDARAVGIPAATGVGSARGLAAMYQAAGGFGEGPSLFGTRVMDTFAQPNVAGFDLVLDKYRSHGIVFQKPTGQLRFGSHRAFGHDGAGGSIGFADPEFQLAFGYTVQQIPFPGGVDDRALELAAVIRSCIAAR